MQLIPKDVKEYIENMYEIPKGQNLALSQIEEAGFFKSQTAKRLIHAGKLKAVTFGRKFFIPRTELIRYLADEMGLLEGQAAKE